MVWPNLHFPVFLCDSVVELPRHQPVLRAGAMGGASMGFPVKKTGFA